MNRRAFLFGIPGTVLAIAKAIQGYITYDDEPVAVIRDSGLAFGTAKHGDTGMRWRVLAGDYGTHQWGNSETMFASFGPHVAADGRVMYEFDSCYPYAPVGIVLNDRGGACISLTAIDGKLVIRDERAARELMTIGGD